ncbi:hypothetical protein C8F01DRAFT_1364673 [Mycena amicta]|nr:hypothetical protein C8F01DRAFT_1364673 [Mycena amicta]
MMLVFLVALTLFNTSGAAPIPARRRPVSSSTACLVVLAGILLLLACLVVLKRVFVHIRRVNIAQQDSALSLPLSASALGSDDSASSLKEKSAYFVGFWGSPTVEVQCALEKKDWKQSFAYQIHTDSRRPRLDYPSVLDTSGRFKITPPRQSEPRTVSQDLKLPSFPAAVHSPMLPQRRRFSLPAMNLSAAREHHRRRHSSLKSAKKRRSLSFSPAISSPSSIDDHNNPSSLSPRLRAGNEHHLPLPWTIPTSKFGRSLSRPFPPLPFTTHSPTPAVRQISHPFALHPKRSVLTSPPLHAVPGLSPRRRSSDLGQRLSPTLSAFPAPPNNGANYRPKLRVRTRRTSPALGPSPLRTMILPENVGLGMDVASGRKQPDSHASSTSDQPPDALLGIIRELIDETREWDPTSVFMSHSFKNLIQQSGLSVDGGLGVAESDSDHSIRSAEMDLALLGIDFFGSEMFAEVSSEGPEDGHEAVGLAW